uniref:Uncharacterized protein n=1 Tax=Spongospora subterranea TaxID=70186 RepID=A0A0H5QFN3_9EUKA|eukprot:CRZ00765.1 hypothetical protein [Spongospora subterranea]
MPYQVFIPADIDCPKWGPVDFGSGFVSSGGATIPCQHWILYGTYVKISSDVCHSRQLEKAFSIVLVMGHALLGLPSMATAVLWRLNKRKPRQDSVEELTLFQANDQKVAAQHETNSLLFNSKA